MIQIIKGEYNEAKVFTDKLDNECREQIKGLLDLEVFQDAQVRIMPDCHAGASCVIGFTADLGDKIIPNIVGVDIGCGMLTVELGNIEIDFERLDMVIRDHIPSGREVHTGRQMRFEELQKMNCYRSLKDTKAIERAIGSLGGGNHFIEVDKDEKGNLYIIVHSGSRHLGKEVTDYYINEGVKLLKAKGIEVPYPMTYIEGKLMEQYLADVKVVQEYAALNREIILSEIVKGMKLKVTEEISTTHNYMDMTGEELLLRKGAISAKAGEKVIIPINMKDGILLGTGKGNKEWNCSAPHGSGRKLRRDEVKNQYTVSAFKSEMKGIHCICIGADTLDEAPFAYRGLEQIRNQIGETVEVTEVLKPVYNFKAGGKG